MSNYTGCKCTVCGQRFDENSDVVVCPECGTPYHRECYEKEGSCVNTALHEKGESWKAEPEQGEGAYKKCSACGSMNKPHTLICENCGVPLVKNLDGSMYGENIGGGGGWQNNASQGVGGAFGFDPMDKCCGMNPEEEFEGVKLRNIAEFVGTNQMYYLPIFKKMKDTGKKISVNIVSLFFPQFYFANRKMWFWTLVTMFITTLINLPAVIIYLKDMLTQPEFAQMFEAAGMTGALLERFSESSMVSLYNSLTYVDLAFRIVLFLFSNWFYYRHCLKKISIRTSENGTASPQVLASAGGTSIVSMFLSVAIQFVVTGIIMTVLLR